MKSKLVAENIAYGNHARQKLDVYAPCEPSDRMPVIMFWYGGSWRGGSKSKYHTIGKALAGLGTIVIIADYRLHPEVRFPVFVEDAALATKWAEEQTASFGGNPKKIVLMGHSAGAHIASILALDKHYLTQAGVYYSSIAAFIGLSGPYDFYPRPDLKSTFDLSDPAQPWRPINLVKNPKIPFLLIHGGLDILVQPSSSERLAQAITASGGSVVLKKFFLAEHMSTLFGLVWPFSWLFPSKQTIKKFLDSLGT